MNAVRLTLGDNRQGFVLIELLVALAVLGLVAVPVLAAFLTGYCSLGRAGDKTRAVNLARGQMEQVKGLGYPKLYFLFVEQENTPQTTREGPFDLETAVIPEKMSIGSPSGEGMAELELLRITVTVCWGEGNSLRLESLLCNR